MQVIATNQAPKAIGPYSQGIRVGNFLFLSGQIPLDPKTGTVVSGGIAEQTKQVLENIKAVLAEAGMGFSNVVKTTIFLTDLSHFGTVNEIYGSCFKEPYPARSTVQVAKLPKEVAVEIEVVAVAG